MSYTKGEWILEINEEENTVEIYCDEDCDLHPIATLRAGFGCRYMDEVTDNAHLMAASPDLLEVCQRLLEAVPYVSEYDVPIGLWDDLRGAIAKATGEQP